MWRRNESDSVHAQSRVQAASRESCAMATTLAQDPLRAGAHTTDESPASTLLSDRKPSASPNRSRSIPLEKFVIEGGVPLSGTITPAGNKNGALPIIAACLLTDEVVVLSNVPRISDVESMLSLIELLGARVAWTGPGEVSIDASDVSSTTVDAYLAERIRASFLLAGPLLARFGSATMPPPGGGVVRPGRGAAPPRRPPPPRRPR